MVDHTEAEILFNEIYDSTNKKALIYITAKCGSVADIADIFQETYLELYSLIRRHDAGYIKNGEAVVMKLARQKLYSHYTLEQKLKNIIPLTVNGESDESEEFEISDETLTALSAEEMALDSVNYDEIVKIIRGKDELTRKIFHLFYRMDLETPKIASLLGIGKSNVKHRLYRTLEEIRNKLL